MSTLTQSADVRVDTTDLARPRAELAPLPFARLVAVEARKTFDTRSGFWLLAGIAAAATLATAAVIVFAPDSAQVYGSFAQAVGFPMALLLPVLAVLAVTSEWSQRSGLTTFTLVPSRGRVLLAKGVVVVAVGVLSMLLAMAIGALGNLLGAAVNGVDPVWDTSVQQLACIVLANVVGLLMGFTFGVLLRSSAAAITAYVAYGFLLPTVLGLLAAYQSWFADVQGWVDLQFSSTRLYDGGLSATEWAQLGVSGLIWMVVPLAIGVVLVRRSEVT